MSPNQENLSNNLMGSLKKHLVNYSTLTCQGHTAWLVQSRIGTLEACLLGATVWYLRAEHALAIVWTVYYTLQFPACFSALLSTHKFRTQSTVTVLSYQRYKEVPSRERQERRSPPRARQRTGRGRGVRASARPYLRSTLRRLLPQRLPSAGVHGRVHVRSPTLPSLRLAAHSPNPGVRPPHREGTENCRRVQT